MNTIAGAIVGITLCLTTGCSITKSRLATEQLVVSDAVDSAIAQVDFTPLTGQSIFFDTKYLNNARLPGNSNVEYVVSSLRQQMLAYDVRLVEKMEDASIIVEARVGTLGNDGNEVTYGIPGNAALSTASVFFSAPVTAPTMPELSLGRRNHQWGAAKLGVFAYDRTTHQRVWQAGVVTGTSQARDLWVVGVGPFQRGRTYDRVRRRRGPETRDTLSVDELQLADLDPTEAYSSQIDFREPPAPTGLPAVVPAAASKPGKTIKPSGSVN